MQTHLPQGLETLLSLRVEARRTAAVVDQEEVVAGGLVGITLKRVSLSGCLTVAPLNDDLLSVSRRLDRALVLVCRRLCMLLSISRALGRERVG